MGLYDGKTPTGPKTGREPLPNPTVRVETINRHCSTENEEKKESIPIRGSGLVGLRNLGNTCFMNSIIQCFSRLPPIQSFFLSSPTCSARNPRLFRETLSIVQQLWMDRTTVVPSNFKTVMGELNSIFQGYSQHDAQEFLYFFLDGLHSDLNRITSPPPSVTIEQRDGESVQSLANRFWEQYSGREDSSIKDLFCGQLQSKLQCTHCGYESYTFDPFWDLSIPIPEFRSSGLSDCLRSFCASETIPSEPNEVCESCSRPRRVTKQVSVYRLPRIAIIHLKRFSFGSRGSKITTDISFPIQNLSLADICARDSPAQNDAMELYDLIAVSNHHGSLHSGHYTSFCRMNTDSWYRFDDSFVERVSTTSIGGSSAYILFYCRKDLLD